LLAGIVRRLAEVYGPERIYQFGSTAGGDARPDSIYDLVVLALADACASRRNPALGYSAGEGLARSGGFLVWTGRRFEGRVHLQASLRATALREGRLLYAA
jgi:predicted nucleotidyltransferase